MLICIDYDDTFTADPIMWENIIRVMKISGHKVICATMRYPQEGEEVKKYLGDLVDEIHFTCRKGKKTYLAELDINPNIWIDDKPEWLFIDG